jgi:tetratricopeptide (TPR) repeat protein
MTQKDYFALGMAKVKENEHQKAIELFTIVLKTDPKNADALSQRAVCYLNLEKYDLSMFDMNQAIEFDPDYSYRYSCRAYLKARMRDHIGAVEDYQKAVELDPEDHVAYNNLGLAQEQLGYAQASKRSFNKSDELNGIKPKNEIPKSFLNEGKLDSNYIKPEKTPSKGEVLKDVLTKKSTFKEFLSFIKNGFKLTKDDKS